MASVPDHLTNLEILCFVLGWQGGTVHQVAEATGCSIGFILEANAETMRSLCRVAQQKRQHYPPAKAVTTEVSKP